MQGAPHAYGHRLVDVRLAGFAPAFTLSLGDSECSRKPPNAHSLGRYVQQQKNKKVAVYYWFFIKEYTPIDGINEEVENRKE